MALPLQPPMPSMPEISTGGGGGYQPIPDAGPEAEKEERRRRRRMAMMMGAPVQSMKRGGMVRGDGCCTKGRTKGKMR